MRWVKKFLRYHFLVIKGLIIVHIIKFLTDSNSTSHGIDKSKSLIMTLTSSFSSSVICVMLVKPSYLPVTSNTYIYFNENDYFLYHINVHYQRSFALDFCIDFTFFDLFKTERVIEINHVRDSVNNVLSKYDHIDEYLQIKVFGVIDDISLTIIDGNVEKLVVKKN